MATTIRRRPRSRARRRRALRRVAARLGFWGSLALAVGALAGVQWLLNRPLILAALLCAAAVALVGYVAWRRHGGVPARMSPDQFEHHIAQLLARDGCTDVQVVGGANDLGADVIATTPAGLRIVAQCKRYAKKPVGSPEVQRFCGTARPVHRAHLAVMVTTSRYTAPAQALAAQQGIQLVDGRVLQAWHAGTMPAPWA